VLLDPDALIASPTRCQWFFDRLDELVRERASS
jgi:hypothetical protein